VRGYVIPEFKVNVCKCFKAMKNMIHSRELIRILYLASIMNIDILKKSKCLNEQRSGQRPEV